MPSRRAPAATAKPLTSSPKSSPPPVLQREHEQVEHGRGHLLGQELLQYGPSGRQWVSWVRQCPVEVYGASQEARKAFSSTAIVATSVADVSRTASA